MKRETLFVYGSLSGGMKYRESLLGEDGGLPVAASVKGCLVYLKVSNFGALTEGDDEVEGELLEVGDEALARLDYLHGIRGDAETGEFVRLKVKVTPREDSVFLTNRGKEQPEAWTYFMPGERLKRLAGGYVPVPKAASAEFIRMHEEAEKRRSEKTDSEMLEI